MDFYIPKVEVYNIYELKHAICVDTYSFCESFLVAKNIK